ncbi:MAG: hypothetical protein WBB85_05835 [Albidovulum sp.]|uniref:hypothetical protein n=1 Tax=Albidovulum sp. TaxID=1872424 RepID=UPI003CA1D9A7
MKKQMIAAITAIALTLTSAAATPAAAQERGNDALKVLLGAAAIGLLISQANKDKRSKEKAKVTRRQPYDGWNHRKDKVRHNNRRIPAQCVFAVRGHDVVSSRCLQEFGAARNVPSSCAFVINTSWGKRTVYGSRCLRDRGYRVTSYR